MSQEIRIPDIGDADSVEVVEILVAPGDRVGPEDPVIVIESDKASMEVPAGLAGVIEAIAVAVGDQVVEGQVIATLAAAAEAAPAEAAPAEAAPAEAAPAAPAPTAPAPRPPAAEHETPVAQAPAPARERHEVRVPNIGESDHVVVIEIAAAVNAEVEPDDLLVVIESDKASMEIPVGVSGRIVAIHVSEGDEVAEGALLATVDVLAAREPAERPKARAAGGAVAQPAAEAVAERAKSPARAEADVLLANAEAAVAGAGRVVEPTEPVAGAQVYAGPAVRRLARELGVALDQVQGSGHRGRIVKEDLKAFVKARMSAAPAEPARGTLPAVPQVDFSRFGEVEIVPLSRVRARGADNLHRSWINIPHVTQHDDIDITELEGFRKSLKAEAEAQGVRLTPIAFLIRACCQALTEFPTLNASLDADARNFILKRYINIGIAVDTDDGLVVPVIRAADRKGVLQLAREVADLSDKARQRKLTPADHQGGTFSITSLGTLGGTGFTPIINAPEVAILGVGRLAIKPQWNGVEFVPREMLPISLSYDHRAINGAEAARFVARLTQLLGDIRRLLL